MSTSKLRKIIQKTGFDLHRFQSEPDRLAWLRTSDIKTIIDVGANVGQFAKEIRSVLPAAQIFSFEPLSNCYQELIRAMGSDAKFRAFNFALGDKNETIVMNRSSYTPSSSILPMADIHKQAFPHSKDSTPEEIAVKKMDEALANVKLESEILIKVDTQGYEDKVIVGGLNIFSKARILIIETSFIPLYTGQPLFADIYRTLTSMDFIYCGALHQKLDKNSGKILFEDSLFERTKKVN